MALIGTKRVLALHSRQGTQIDNQQDRAPAAAGLQLKVDDFKKKYPNALHRPVGPCSIYNCHGMTFAARRTWIHDPAVVQRILEEDDYKPIPLGKVMAGDIVIYRNDGDIEHSGIVIDKVGLVPKILSKWGQCHEVVHFANDCEYVGMDIQYYRIVL